MSIDTSPGRWDLVLTNDDTMWTVIFETTYVSFLPPYILSKSLQSLEMPASFWQSQTYRQVNKLN